MAWNLFVMKAQWEWRTRNSSLRTLFLSLYVAQLLPLHYVEVQWMLFKCWRERLIMLFLLARRPPLSKLLPRRRDVWGSTGRQDGKCEYSDLVWCLVMLLRCTRKSYLAEPANWVQSSNRGLKVVETIWEGRTSTKTRPNKTLFWWLPLSSSKRLNWRSFAEIHFLGWIRLPNMVSCREKIKNIIF